MMRSGLIIVLLASFFLGAAATADESIALILDQAPADSDLLIIVPSLSRFSEKVALFDSQIGLGRSDLRNVWSQIKHITGLTNAIMEDGPAMVAISTARGNDTSVDQTRAWLLLRVSDYAKVATALRGSGGGEVTPVILATGHRAFAARNGSFAVFVRDEDSAKAYQPANAAAAIARRLGPSANQCLQYSDIALVLHGKDHAATLKALTQMLTEQTNSMAAIPPSAMTILDWVLDNPLLRDADAAVLGLKLSEEGLSLTYGAQFKPGSPMANMFAGSAPAAEVLARLPRMRYVAASAANLQGIKYNDLESLKIAAPFIVDPWLQNTILQVGKKGQPITGFAQVKYSSGLLGPFVVQYIATDEAPGFAAALQKNIEAMNAMPDLKQKDQQTFTAQYFPNNDTVNGKRVDRYNIRPHEINAATQPPLNGAWSILPWAEFTAENRDSPRDGLVVELEHAVIITEPVDYELLMSVIDAAGNTTELGRKGPATASRQYLAEQSSLEIYFDLATKYDMSSGSAQGGLTTAQDLPVPPPDMEPIALGLKTTDQDIVFRCFVPTAVSEYLYSLKTPTGKTMQERITGQQRPPYTPRSPARHDRNTDNRQPMPAKAPAYPFPGAFTPPR